MIKADTMTGMAPTLLLNMFLERAAWPHLPAKAQAAYPALAMRRFGYLLENPLGVAAGPHSQMAQNLVAAWLAGARWMELKTVQQADAISIEKPCIYAKEEGYNCEWSQEMNLEASFEEYLKAALVIRALRATEATYQSDSEDGFLFNMSAGYTLEGLQSRGMQRFFDSMANCSAHAARLLPAMERVCPALKNVEHSKVLCNSITLSTMHGCPPQDIEAMARHLMENLGLHTTIKLNPTLLGPEKLRHILNQQLGYSVQVPDAAFEHDLTFSAATHLIRSLTALAAKTGREFHIKLTNTLECINTGQLPASQKHVYLSGRALHPLGLAVANELQNAFAGELDLSFCAGLDQHNITGVYASGMAPLTICTDLLKPGSYSRLGKALAQLNLAMAESGCTGQNEYVKQQAGTDNLPAARLAALQKLAATATAANGPCACTVPHKGRVKAAEKPCAPHCRICTTVCPNLALVLVPQPEGATEKDAVMHFAALCNQCGNCAVFCPAGGVPWQRKHHIHLTKESFQVWGEGTLVPPLDENNNLEQNISLIHTVTASLRKLANPWVRH